MGKRMTDVTSHQKAKGWRLSLAERALLPVGSGSALSAFGVVV